MEKNSTITLKNEQAKDDINFTQKELMKTVKADLVPQELLKQHESVKHFDQIKKTKNKNKTNYNSKIKEDILVIDKKIEGAVNVLENGSFFNLYEGVCLRINEKELPEWEKEAKEAKNLNDEQKKTFKKVLDNYPLDKPLTRKEIVTLIEEVRKPQLKSKKYRHAGHFLDQKLKYQKEQNQLSLFDILLPETQQKIQESRVEVTAEGIKLTYAENKLVHALNLLLCEKSQNADPESDSFYSGNAQSELVPYGVPDQQAKAPVLKFKPSELYKAFMGTKEYSGADIKFINSTLYQLEEKKVLIKYDRVKTVIDGKKTKTLTDRIEDFQSLIKIVLFIPDLSDLEKSKLNSGDNNIRSAKSELIIALNPIFRDQIDTKFIEFPEDTNRRLVIAAGGHKKVTTSMNILMEYMLREMSAKRYRAEINEENLPYVIGLEKYVKEKRKKLLQERIEKDIQAIINIGIILNAEKKPNKIGGMKWIFQLNKEYE